MANKEKVSVPLPLFENVKFPTYEEMVCKNDITRTLRIRTIRSSWIEIIATVKLTYTFNSLTFTDTWKVHVLHQDSEKSHIKEFNKSFEANQYYLDCIEEYNKERSE